MYPFLDGVPAFLRVLAPIVPLPVRCVRLFEGLDPRGSPNSVLLGVCNWLFAPLFDGVSTFPKVFDSHCIHSWMVCPPTRGSRLPLHPFLDGVPAFRLHCTPSWRGPWLPLFPSLEGVPAFPVQRVVFWLNCKSAVHALAPTACSWAYAWVWMELGCEHVFSGRHEQAESEEGEAARMALLMEAREGLIPWFLM